MSIENKGKVILAGAGPGDPDLISVKALKYLQTADVILTDRLVSPQMIADNAKKAAIIIYVGKQCSKGIHTPQSDINTLMVEFAKQNKLVLRLKGGDASLFSNVLDELEVLKANHILYEIVPGISAAFGAAAYTGIPLTAREHARGVRFLTLFDLSTVTALQWTDWATTDDTLVFYMSGQRLHQLANYLLTNNIDVNKGIAVVQQATTPFQKTRVFSFEELKTKELPAFEYVPTLLIVGNVVNLHRHYAWFKEQSKASSYFDNHIINLQHAG
ncbi:MULTISPECIES: uroporphyrinogen-III C-methyltransferase [unclassified Flavobacterium]|uniref:uroporphyrinogen-III C-methyltransferase n=1 Tax=unclassified Flavobacterium TaxID=196869 RepID=UPI00095B5F3E|nr:MULTISPECIES: uroporphyrinogen-III C-methyltransferase [unclassified Flavobacterium]MBN9283821.1 uroporphyrinogen-III C-methyltransferase [Flavobacterium sp.]OJV68675.1 MAG: uroporphyrinogen-III C-methyltransferase [Flavobacterium sp. 40-81]